MTPGQTARVLSVVAKEALTGADRCDATTINPLIGWALRTVGALLVVGAEECAVIANEGANEP
jgi:hypothetical protein